jgi:hypothetical protein
MFVEFVQIAHGKSRNHKGKMNDDIPHHFFVIDIGGIHKDFVTIQHTASESNTKKA